MARASVPVARGRLLRLIVTVVAAVATAAMASAADALQRKFDLPAGEARGTLVRFAEQADCEILFPAATVAGIRTRAVKGLFPPREALERMVAGTNLVIVPNAVTGVIAVTLRGESGPVVKLPPYTVTQARVEFPWLHAVIPGFEVISCCPSRETEEFVDEIHRQQACLDEILPSDLQGFSAVPIHLLLLSSETQPAMSRDVLTLISGTSPGAGLIPQIKLWDEDSVAIAVVLEHRDEGEYRGVGYTPNYLYFLLGRRIPRLPLWLIEGVVNLYENLCWQNGGAAIPAATGRPWRSPWLKPTATQAGTQYPGSIAGVVRLKDENSPRLWIPPLRSESPAGTSETTWPLPPLEEIFNRPPVLQPVAGQEAYAADWQLESTLFVRWAFEDEGSRRKALWRFVELSGSGHSTEAIFKDCFGLNFAEMHAELGAYRRVAEKDGFFWKRTNPVELPRPELRPATTSESARLLGDWECKELEFVQKSHPEYAPCYIALARRTLRGAYEKGERDAGIVAALGLYECAVGHDLPARDFLEAAVRAGVVRPRAYVELARIRLAEALAAPVAKGGRLDAEQTLAVLDLLGAVRLQPPPQLRAYLLAAEAWEHSVLLPAASDLAFLEEGGRFFPDDSALAAAIGRLRAVKN